MPKFIHKQISKSVLLPYHRNKLHKLAIIPKELVYLFHFIKTKLQIITNKLSQYESNGKVDYNFTELTIHSCLPFC